MSDINEVFKAEPAKKEDELKRRLVWLRRQSVSFSHWPIKEVQRFCIEWQEVTGKLLEAGNRPGSEEKFADAEIKRRQLKEIEKRGIARK